MEEDDWETIVIPDLLSEREKRLLEERKKVEESDAELSKDLFTQAYKGSPLLFTKEKPRLVEEMPNGEGLKTIKCNQQYQYKKQQYKKQQEELQQQVKQKKIQNKRISEIFGETQLDDYYEAYGHIEGKYFHA